MHNNCMGKEKFFENMAFETANYQEVLIDYGLKTDKLGEITKTYLNIDNKVAEKLNRRAGVYITYTTNSDFIRTRNFDRNLYKYMSKDIYKLAKSQTKKLQSVLIVGLGNSYMTADSLGNLVLKKINIKGNKKIQLMGFSPGVSGLTGIESADMIKGVVAKIHPSLVIIVDSLATSKTERLCSAFQISTSGIIPGGGVGNARELLSEKTLKIPVIVIGVPLVLNFKSLLTNIFIEFYMQNNIELNGQEIHNIVKNKLNNKNLYCLQEIDVFVDKIAEVIAKSLNEAFI